MTYDRMLLAIAMIAAITFSTRLLPFLIFGKGGQPSEVVVYLGKYLPPAIICGIIVYCFKDVHFLSGTYGIPEIVAVLAVLLLHRQFKNTMISIFCGTALYMILLQLL